MKIATKYISMLAAAVMLSWMAVGCIHDKVDEPDGYTGMDDTLADDEYGMGIVVALDGLTRVGGISHGTDLATADEDYVDTEHLYVLFFNIDGIFLFNIQNPTAIPMGSSGTENDHLWFIRIPVKTINPNLIKYIEDNPFKIAVLANWTFDEEGNAPASWDRFEFKEPVDDAGNLVYDENGKLTGNHISQLVHAQLDNAYLVDDDADDDDDDDSDGTGTIRDNGYGHLFYLTGTGPHMGPYIEWVKNFNKSISEAEQKLRTSYDIENHRYTNSQMDSRQKVPIHYNDMWRLWNFGGKSNAGDEKCYLANSDAIRTKWIENNQKAKESFDESVSKNELSKDSDKYWPLKNHEKDLRFYGRVERVYDENDEAVGFKVPVAPNFTEEQNDRGDGFPAKMSYAHFYAKADGFVRVRYKTVGQAKIKAHIGLYNYTKPADDTQYKHNRESRDEKEMKVAEYTKEDEVFIAFADIPNLQQHVYIYAIADPKADDDDADSGAGTGTPEGGEGGEGSEGEGGDVEPEPEPEPGIIIYEIEFIESRHLYDVDREGILPSKQYPIPMYGIQDFDPIGEYWQPGLLFNLSMFNNAVKEGYNYRSISLLRSLARVEVLIDKNAFESRPSHVYMRSMNRSARITPVDLFTPTDIIWNGYDRTSKSDIARLQHYIDSDNFAEQDILSSCAGVDKEIERIMQFGPIYIGRDDSGKAPNRNQSAEEKLREYRMTTAWPFGIWEQQWGWNWNRDDKDGGTIPYFETYKKDDTRLWRGQTVPEYPNILHTRISRSDYARFHYLGEDGQYYRYLIYIPEKNISDADNPGNIADRPKVVHVELRFNSGLESNPDDNQIDNFDDNGAFRMYFTPNGRSDKYTAFEGRKSWDSYEYDWAALSDHWPIMRNHIYRFVVDGGGPNYTDHNITFTVEAPEKRTVSWDFY